jgi:hypothetical protein
LKEWVNGKPSGLLFRIAIDEEQVRSAATLSMPYAAASSASSIFTWWSELQTIYGCKLRS